MSRETRFPVAFPGDIWRADLAASDADVAAIAQRARKAIERQGGLSAAQLHKCDDEAHDGTQLPGCVKHYVGPRRTDGKPPDWGMVFEVRMGPTGRPYLQYLAFGRRHYPKGSQRETVYRRAHNRLHG